MLRRRQLSYGLGILLVDGLDLVVAGFSATAVSAAADTHVVPRHTTDRQDSQRQTEPAAPDDVPLLI